ncbi:Swarming motility protein YbiA [compost metagenome]
MNYNNTWLVEKFKSKEKIKYLFFWGHHPSKNGSITQSCFSQWWHSSFEVDGVKYKTAEHWMMAEQARLFDDDIAIEKILKTNTPAEAKKMGRLVKNFNAVIWDQHKFEIVVNGNLHKFSQHDAMKTFLINTKERVLVEASPVDNIWGIGMAADHEHIENPLKWRGENLLGYALMEVRDKLK